MFHPISFPFSRTEAPTGRRPATLALATVLALVASHATSVHAQTPPETTPPPPQRDADEDARIHFDAGRAAYAAGQFDTAVREFRRAYVLSGRFELLFNIGMAELRAGRDSAALTAFEGFKRQAPPDAPNLGQVEERIRVLRGMGVEPESETTRPPVPTPTDTPPETTVVTPLETSPPPPAERSAAPFIVIGAGGAVLIAGGVLMGLGQARANEVTDAPVGSSWPELQDTADRAKLFWGMGIGMGITGLAAIGAGTAWRLSSRGDASSDSAPTARLRVGLGSVTVEGAF